MYSAQWSMFRHSNSSIRSSLLVSYLVHRKSSQLLIKNEIVVLLELFNFVLQRELFLISVNPEDAQDWVPLHNMAVRAQEDLGLVLHSRHPHSLKLHSSLPYFSGLVQIFISHLLTLTMTPTSADLTCSKNIGTLPDSFIGQNNVI